MHRGGTGLVAHRPGGAAAHRPVATAIGVVLALVVAVGVLIAGPSPAITAADVVGPGLAYVPGVPSRIADTRLGLRSQRMTDRQVRVDLGEWLTDDVDAVLVSLTVVGHHGWAVATPAGAAPPGTSHVNLAVPGAASGLAIVRVSADRAIDVHTSGPAIREVIVDLIGTFVAAEAPRAGRLVGLAPHRLVDTREAAAVPAGGVLGVALPTGVPDDAVALAVNITVLPHGPSGYVTAMAAGAPVPDTSLLNVSGAGRVGATAAIVPASSTGIALYTTVAADLIVDVAGYFTGPSAEASSDGRFVPFDPGVRRIDTRYTEAGWVRPGGTLEVGTGADGGLFFGTVTMVDTTEAGYVTLHAAGSPRPLASTTNANGPLEVVSNSAFVAMGSRGIAVFSSHGAHVVVDQYGVFTGGRAAPGGSDAPGVGSLGSAPADPIGPCDTIVDELPPLESADRARTVVRIGTSVAGRPIRAEYHGPPEPSQVVLIVGQVHGNECAPLLFVDAVRRHRWRDVGVWLVPTLNPDGAAELSRYNAAGIDLNKDGGALSQPETRALMQFTTLVAPTMTVHVHSPNGQVAWYGSGRYVANAPARSGAGLTGPLAARIAGATGLSFTGAGERVSSTAWFLWQGQRAVLAGHEALLVELYAVSAHEVPGARPRPPTRSVAAVRDHCRAIVSLIEGSFA